MPCRATQHNAAQRACVLSWVSIVCVVCMLLLVMHVCVCPCASLQGCLCRGALDLPARQLRRARAGQRGAAAGAGAGAATQGVEGAGARQAGSMRAGRRSGWEAPRRPSPLCVPLQFCVGALCLWHRLVHMHWMRLPGVVACCVGAPCTHRSTCALGAVAQCFVRLCRVAPPPLHHHAHRSTCAGCGTATPSTSG